MISARRGRRAAKLEGAPDRLDRMPARKPVKVVAVALAARMARTVWALIARGDSNRAVPSREQDRRRPRSAAPRW
jgi:transposase